MSQHSTADTSIDRRRVLKLAGATVVGATATAGVASAHPPNEIRFCGCSRVCVDRDERWDPFWVIVAKDVDGDFECRELGMYKSNRCVDAPDGYKIIAIRGGDDRIYCNPNHCAQMVIDRSTDPTCPDTGDCVRCRQVDRHLYDCGGVTVRTRKCQPPSKWGNDPGGPSNDDQGGGGPPNDDQGGDDPSDDGQGRRGSPTDDRASPRRTALRPTVGSRSR